MTIKTTVTMVSPVAGRQGHADAHPGDVATRTARKAVTRANKVNRMLLRKLSACQSASRGGKGGDQGYAFVETFSVAAQSEMNTGPATPTAAEVVSLDVCEFCEDSTCHWKQTEKAALIALAQLTGCVRSRRMGLYKIYKHMRRLRIGQGMETRYDRGNVRVPMCVVRSARELVNAKTK